MEVRLRAAGELQLAGTVSLRSSDVEERYLQLCSFPPSVWSLWERTTCRGGGGGGCRGQSATHKHTCMHTEQPWHWLQIDGEGRVCCMSVVTAVVSLGPERPPQTHRAAAIKQTKEQRGGRRKQTVSCPLVCSTRTAPYGTKQGCGERQALSLSLHTSETRHPQHSLNSDFLLIFLHGQLKNRQRGAVVT